jgi:hypothetical protein
MAIEPVKIPQNVYIEDRIVGPLTLRQTMIMALGGGFSYAMYSLVSKANGAPPGMAATIILWLPCVISVAFALIKINDLSLSRILLLSIERAQKAPVRTWSPRRGISITIRTSSGKKDTRSQGPTTPQGEAQQKIKELSNLIDGSFTPMASQAPEQPLPPDAPEVAETAQVTELEQQEESEIRVSSPQAQPAVDPSRISVDKTEPGEPYKQLSDLSVFRDIFPHS